MTKFNVFISITVLFVAGVISHPAYRKEFDKILNSNDCLKGCMSNLTKFDEEISLMKNPNLQRYFGKIDDICALIGSTRDCIDKCENVESNPFALESVNVICLPEIKEKVDKINDCLVKKSDVDIYANCASGCGDYNSVNDEVHRLTQSIQEFELKDNGKVNPIMEKTNQACGIFKCATKCNVDALKAECDAETADLLQSILQQIFNTHFSDLQKLNIVETMSKTIPPQCSYMWDPSAIFTTTKSTDLSNPQNPQELLGKVQLELLLKQLKLVEKQDDLIDRENQKLDMEMDLLSQKLHHKHQQQVQQQQPKSFEESRFFL